MSAVAKHNNLSEVSHHPQEGTRAWLFHEFWPIMLFAGFFVLMCSIPLVLTGILTLQGLSILAVFIAALMLVSFVPRTLPLFLLFVAFNWFVVTPQAWDKGAWIVTTFFAFTLIGMAILPLKACEKHKSL
jgi:hypothetical protein